MQRKCMRNGQFQTTSLYMQRKCMTVGLCHVLTTCTRCKERPCDNTHRHTVHTGGPTYWCWQLRREFGELFPATRVCPCVSSAPPTQLYWERHSYWVDNSSFLPLYVLYVYIHCTVGDSCKHTIYLYALWSSTAVRSSIFSLHWSRISQNICRQK